VRIADQEKCDSAAPLRRALFELPVTITIERQAGASLSRDRRQLFSEFVPSRRQNYSAAPKNYLSAASALAWRAEIEQLEQVANRRAVDWHVWVEEWRDRVGEIVPAAVCDGRQIPVSLDELEDGDMIRIVVCDTPAG